MFGITQLALDVISVFIFTLTDFSSQALLYQLQKHTSMSAEPHLLALALVPMGLSPMWFIRSHGLHPVDSRQQINYYPRLLFLPSGKSVRLLITYSLMGWSAYAYGSEYIAYSYG